VPNGTDSIVDRPPRFNYPLRKRSKANFKSRVKVLISCASLGSSSRCFGVCRGDQCLEIPIDPTLCFSSVETICSSPYMFNNKRCWGLIRQRVISWENSPAKHEHFILQNRGDLVSMHRRKRIQEFCEIPNVVFERFQGLRVVGAGLASRR